MHEGFRKVFWGLCFATFHITIGGLKLLPVPAFIGYLMVYSGINMVLAGTFKEPSADGPEITPNPNAPFSHSLFFKRASRMSLVCSAFALVGLFEAFVQSLSIQAPMFSLIWMALESLAGLALAYNLLGGAVALMRAQELEAPAGLLQKKLKMFIILYSALVMAGLVGVTMNQTSAVVIFILMMLGLRLWLIGIIHGLQQPPVTLPQEVDL